MERLYRALIPATGEILEDDSFKVVYRIALGIGKDYLRTVHMRYDVADDESCTVVNFERVRYSDYEYINSYGYPQRDIVEREHIAYVAITERGYTVDTAIGQLLDVDRQG